MCYDKCTIKKYSYTRINVYVYVIYIYKWRYIYMYYLTINNSVVLPSIEIDTLTNYSPLSQFHTRSLSLAIKIKCHVWSQSLYCVNIRSIATCLFCYVYKLINLAYSNTWLRDVFTRIAYTYSKSVMNWRAPFFIILWTDDASLHFPKRRSIKIYVQHRASLEICISIWLMWK